MSELEEILKYGSFVGIVEENEDPDKKQRVRIRIPFLHGKSTEIPTSSLPWAQPFRDMNGLTCVIPDKAKIVNVTFPWGNAYYPVYNSAEHLNVNLQKKLEEYSGEDYTNFISLLYNHNTQIYVDNQKGLFLRHKFNEINLNEDGIINQLHTNDSTLYLGDASADQDNILGTNFMKWMDTLMETLMDAYIGNLGAPVIANPNLINVFTNYQAQRENFLSEHVKVVNNFAIRNNKIILENTIGDDIEMSDKNKVTNIKVTKIPDYTPPPPVSQIPPVENTIIQLSANATESPTILNPQKMQNVYTDVINFKQASDKKISEKDIVELSKDFGLVPASVWSILKNETGGRGGFYTKGKDVGKPKILFEGHVFYAQMKKKGMLSKVTDNSLNILYPRWQDRGNAYSLNQYDRLNAAIQYDLQAALCSASWGVGQIMGNNYGSCGYKNVEEFVRYMYYSEKEQFKAMLTFITNNKAMKNKLEALDWAGFAYRYNGAGYAENQYDIKLANTYNINKNKTSGFS